MRSLTHGWMALLVVAALIGTALPQAACGQYFRRPVSEINPNIMLIDEKAHLGSGLAPETVLVDHQGREFKWGDKLDRPVILVLSYFTCDGSCSVINRMLADLMKDVKLVSAGKDFNIVTLSFDHHDNLRTTSAFVHHLETAGPLAPDWTFATFKREEDLKSETQKIGFKFFWSPEDRVFLHPGAFLFFGMDGRMIRVLYQEEVAARDIELAVLDAKQGQFTPRELVTFALSLCYSYSYHDGKYVMSIPILVMGGSLLVGIATLLGSIVFFKAGKRAQRAREERHAEAI